MPQRILIVRNNHLGDVVLITPLVKSLKVTCPKIDITVVAGHWAADILLGNPYIDKIIRLDLPWGHRRESKAKLLGQAFMFFMKRKYREVYRDAPYDLCIDLSAHPLTTLMAWLMKIPFRVGVSSVSNHEPMLSKTIFHEPGARVLETFSKVETSLGLKGQSGDPEIYLSPEDVEWAKLFLQAHDLKKGEFAVIAPGCGWPTHKAWLKESFAELIGLLWNRKNCRVVLVGSTSEADILKWICDRSNAINTAGQLSLGQYSALVAISKAVICNNSAAFHIARAFSIPSVVICSGLYGGVVQQEKSWGYPGYSVFVGGDKKDCDQTCALSCYEQICMKEVGPEKVFGAFDMMLKNRT